MSRILFLVIGRDLVLLGERLFPIERRAYRERFRPPRGRVDLRFETR